MDKKQTKVHKTPTLHQFLFAECVVSYGVMNGIINGLIFFFLHRADPAAIFSGADLMAAFSFTLVILSPVMACFIFPLTGGKVKKGVGPVRVYEKQDHAVMKWFPQNRVAVTAVVTVLCTLLVPSFFIGAATGLGLLPMGVVAASVLNGVVCLAAGIFTSYFCVLSILFSYGLLQPAARQGTAERA